MITAAMTMVTMDAPEMTIAAMTAATMVTVIMIIAAMTMVTMDAPETTIAAMTAATMVTAERSSRQWPPQRQSS